MAYGQRVCPADELLCYGTARLLASCVWCTQVRLLAPAVGAMTSEWGVALDVSELMKKTMQAAGWRVRSMEARGGEGSSKCVCGRALCTGGMPGSWREEASANVCEHT